MRFRNIFFVLIVVLLTLGTVFPLFHSGFFAFHDNTAVVRVYEMSKSLSNGMFPVRWVEGLGYGYGYPIFNFYGPFPYYLGGSFVQIGFDPLFATKAMLVAGMILAGITMFFFSKRFFGVAGGVVSAVMYSYFPYHAVNLYVRGAIGELFAYAFLPLVFLGLFSAIELRNKKSSSLQVPLVLPLVFGVFLVAVSHNLSFLMLLVLLVPVSILAFILSDSKKKFVVLMSLSVILGIVLSSFYTIPAFLEMRYTNVASQIGGGANFADHFVCIGQFWESQWGYGGSVPGCLDGISFVLGKGNILFVLLSFGVLVFSLYKKNFRIQEKLVVISTVLFVAAFLFSLQISKIIWDSIPYMDYIQYPWRFINFIALGSSFVVGYLIFMIREMLSKTLVIIVSLVIISIILFANTKFFVPQSFNNYQPSYYMQKNYINFTVSKISDEYMPVGFNVPQSENDIPQNKLELIHTPGSISILEAKPNDLKAQYNIGTNGLVHINTAYFPAWRATINGRSVILTPVSNGMDVTLPYGSGILEIKFTQTPIEYAGNILSVLAFFVMLIGIMLAKSYGKKAS